MAQISINSNIANCTLLAIHSVLSTLPAHATYNGRNPFNLFHLKCLRKWKLCATCLVYPKVNMCSSEWCHPRYLRIFVVSLSSLYLLYPLLYIYSICICKYLYVFKKNSREESQNAPNLWFKELFYFLLRNLSSTLVHTRHTHSHNGEIKQEM